MTNLKYTYPWNQVESFWQKITFGLHELIGAIGIRYNGGTYCYALAKIWPHKECENNVFDMKTLNTIHHGRCYTIEFPQRVRFYGKFDVHSGTLANTLLWFYDINLLSLKIAYHGPNEKICSWPFLSK